MFEQMVIDALLLLMGAAFLIAPLAILDLLDVQ
jgi:hypothetical protein